MKTMMWMTLLAAILVSALIGCSSSSNSTNNNNTAPASPTNILVTQTVRDVVHVAWSDNSANEDSFVVQRSVNNANWQDVGGTAMNVASFNDNSTIADTKYYYRVRADNSYGNSDFATSGAYWTWPMVYDFSTDQTGNFQAFSLDGVAPYHSWTWDNAAQAGKMTITHPVGAQYLTSVVALDSMSNNGWFESKMKIANWYGTTRPSEVAFFVDKDASALDDAVGVIFNTDSVRVGYYRSGGGAMTRIYEGHNDYFTANAWHTVKFFHNGDNWQVWIDDHSLFNSTIANVATGSYKLVQEWQFDRGDGPDNQNYWLDDVANPGPTVALLNASGSHRTLSRPVAKK